MRTKRRFALLLASAAALGVGFIAFPGSAAAAPPAGPDLYLPGHRGERFLRHASDHRGRRADRAGVRAVSWAFGFARSSSPATSETTSVKLQFDDDITFNLAGIPTCPAAELTGKTIAQAYEQCGPGADGSRPEGNAYLSPAGTVERVRVDHGPDGGPTPAR